MKTTKNASSLFSLVAISLIAAIGAGAGSLATAGVTDDSPLKATVKYGDLDLSHAAGVSQLYGRIRRAAQTVCSPFEGRGAELTLRWTQCVDQAVNQAVENVNQPVLMALHAAKTGKQQPVRVASTRN
jgi:UrcA family protein